MTTATSDTPLGDLLARAALHPDADLSGQALGEVHRRLSVDPQTERLVLTGPPRRLLPLVQARVDPGDLSEHLASLCNDATTESWGLNERLMQQVGPIVDHLDEAGVTVVGIKGIGLVGSIYPQHWQRAVGDADLLVDVRDGRKATAVLTQAGWHGPEARWNWYDRAGVAKGFAGPTGGSIDLHTRPGRTFRIGRAAVEDVLCTSISLPGHHPLFGSRLRVPSPEWHLVIVAAHTALNANRDLSHGLADVHLLATRSGVDLGTAGDLARHHLVAERCLATFRRCADVTGLDIDQSHFNYRHRRGRRLERRATAAEGLVDGPDRRTHAAGRLVAAVRLMATGKGLLAKFLVAAHYVGNGMRLHRGDAE